MDGYNITFKIGTKTIVGRTQDDLTISATIKESLTKDDAGQKQYAVVGHEVTFKASALFVVGNEDDTKTDRDDLIAQALQTSDDAEIPITYEVSDGDAYEGTAIITNYSESSNASDDATLSIDFKITGDFTKVTQNNG